MAVINDIQSGFYNRVMEDYSYSNINTSTTTVVKSGKGTIKSISVNIKGTVASGVIVYDNTSASGSKIATIDSLTFMGQLNLGVIFNTGLTIVTTGAAAPDITVIYK